jgi:transposase-like protein
MRVETLEEAHWNEETKFTSEFKASVVLEVLSGAHSAAEACGGWITRAGMLAHV